jgi:hypothetical protein
MNFFTNLVTFIVALVFVAIFSLILAFPVMWLWNWIMPAVFGLIKITFWQALGINLLCGFLFRGTTTAKS